MSEKKVYLTTTIPYINADPHLGFALEIVQADAYKRFNAALLGRGVFLNTGTDEHGLKIYRKAESEGKSAQEYVDESAKRWESLLEKLNIDYNKFSRTTSEERKKAAQEFWRKCEDNGDIYKSSYSVKYCVGCELEVTDSELNEEGRCPAHPNLEIELIEEENYFFKFSKYTDTLLKLYEENPEFVLPESRQNEIKNFVGRGLRDFSISRVKEKMPWGVSVPGDPEHVMYVWFDALVNYISAIGWPKDMDLFNSLWPVIQFAGKDNLRQQSAMWQAMLLSAGISPSQKIVIHGFLTSDGAKMSKSLGNVVNPFDVVEEYGTDSLRYHLLRECSVFEDSDFTNEKFKEAYNANLANGLGNLTSRIIKMVSKYEVSFGSEELPSVENVLSEHSEFKDLMEGFKFREAGDYLWGAISSLDKYIEENRPFKTIKTDEEKAKKDLKFLLFGLFKISILLYPFMPETSEKIKKMIKTGKSEVLFERKE